MSSSFVKNDDSHIIKHENEIEKLYESIASDMKSLKS